MTLPHGGAKATSPSESAPSTRNLGARVAVGLRWGAVDQVVQQAMRLGITVLLTRLLTPADFGLIAMALVFTGLTSLFGDVGMAPALVQRQQVTRQHISTAFTTGGLAGALLAGVMALVAGPIAGFFHQPRLQPILAVLGVTYVFSGLQGTPHYLLRRAFMFRPFVFCYALGAGIGGATGIVLAALGGGVWALVAYSLVESFVGLVAAMVFSVRAGLWKPSIGFDRAAARDLLGFSAPVSVSRLLTYFRRNVDNLLIGKVLGATALGLYDLGYTIMLYPIQRISDIVSSVAFPAFSAIQEDQPRMRAAFIRALRTICLVSLPLSIGSAVAAPVFVPLLFGPRWAPAVATVQILALNGPRFALNSLNTSVFQAIGRPYWELKVMIAMTILMVAAFLIGVQFSIEAVAMGFTLVGYLILPFAFRLMRRALDTGPAQTLRALAPVFTATALMAIAAESARRLTQPAFPPSLQLLVVVAVGAAAYLLTLLLIGRPVLIQAVRDVLRRGG